MFCQPQGTSVRCVGAAGERAIKRAGRGNSLFRGRREYIPVGSGRDFLSRTAPEQRVSSAPTGRLREPAVRTQRMEERTEDETSRFP